MNKKQRAAKIISILEEYYPDPQVPLKHDSLYTLLIAVLLSAQCTDARINLITPALFAQANTPEKMIQLSIEEIKAYIQSCGLANSKARAIWNLSHMLLEKYQGKVPQTFEELETLPGVGHKTASVVMAQGFHKAAFPVDTHIHRCAKRWKLSDGRSVEKTEKDLKALFPKEKWIRLHLQIIFFAREHCPARAHDPSLCPICSWI